LISVIGISQNSHIGLTLVNSDAVAVFYGALLALQKKCIVDEQSKNEQSKNVSN